MKLLPALALLLLPALGAAAMHPAADYASGVVPVGSGAPLVPGVDHVRYLRPDDAYGIAPMPTAPPSAAAYAMLKSCGPCDHIPTCLAVYAPAGRANEPYAFAWAYSDGPSVLPFSKMEEHTPAVTEAVCQGSSAGH